MKTTNVPEAAHVTNATALFTKAALVGLFAGAALLATPAKAQAQAGFGFHVGVYAPGPVYYNPGPAYYAPGPVYAAPGYGYYGANAYDRHEDWERDHRDWDRRDGDRRDFDRRDRDDHHDWDRR